RNHNEKHEQQQYLKLEDRVQEAYKNMNIELPNALWPWYVYLEHSSHITESRSSMEFL
ncbi:23226_t:CDS:2, partial [Cetraspora pellucida]